MPAATRNTYVNPGDSRKTGFKVLCAFLKIIYAPLKLLKTRPNKLVFLSRQSDKLSLDASYVIDALNARDDSYEIVTKCMRVKPGFKNKLAYGLILISSVYHMATAKVILLDSYWPAVSVLKHKPELTVIQMWHAIGKVKKSGLQNLNMPNGRSEAVAKIMHMHEGYDIVIAGGKAWNPYYCESFGIDENIIRNVGLPRIDYLVQNRETIRQDFFNEYPELKDKTIVLYAPTFRKEGGTEFHELLDLLSDLEFAVIAKGHPNHKIDAHAYGAYECSNFRTLELLVCADYLITDYSAVAIEAACVGLRTYYYVYDIDKYTEMNGLNVSPFDSMPGCAFKSATELISALQGEYPQSVFDAYRETYLFDNIGSSTEAIVQIIVGEAGLQCKNS